MVTIKQRALAYGLACINNVKYIGLPEPSPSQSYNVGATEQQQIDINKACEWLKEQVYQEYGGGPRERLIPDTMIEEFRKAMEE